MVTTKRKIKIFLCYNTVHGSMASPISQICLPATTLCLIQIYAKTKTFVQMTFTKAAFWEVISDESASNPEGVAVSRLFNTTETVEQSTSSKTD